MRALFGIALALSAAALGAAEWSVQGTADGTIRYDDNYQLAADPRPAWTTTIGGTVAGTYRTETLQSTLNAGLFADIVSVPDQDLAGGRLDWSSSYQLQRSQLGLLLGFLRDSTRASEFQATGVVLQRAPRNLYTFSPSWRYTLTDRASVALRYSLSAARYDTERASTLRDYDSWSASASLIYLLASRDQLSLSYTYSEYETTPLTNRSTTGTASAGLTHRFSERLAGEFSYGRASGTIDVFQTFLVCPAPIDLCLLGIVPLVPVSAQSGREFRADVYQASLSYALDERSGLTAGLGQRVEPSGAGALTRTRSATLRARRQLRERLSGSLGLSVFQNSFAGSPSSLSDTLTVTADAGLDWRFAQDWSLGASVRSSYVDYRTSQTDAKGYSLLVNVRYGWRGPAVSR